MRYRDIWRNTRYQSERCCLRPLLAVLVLLLSAVATAVTQSPDQPLAPDRIEYWRSQYQELTPTGDPWAATAHEVFAKLVQVAGKRPGVVPRLFITAKEPWGITLPIAIQDGWIILSRGALEICFREPTWAKDRLAFILGHELAHHLKDDLWHLRFSSPVETGQTQTPVTPAFVRNVIDRESTREHVLAREVQADQQGILYATMAGFTPRAIVDAAQGVNFFADWVRALDPRSLLGINAAHLRPTPEQRAEALLTVLRQIADQAVAFQAGLWWYYAGDYPQAIQAFDAFRVVFAGPEVHLNLAASHHQMALQAYRAWHPAADLFPFHLPLALDPLTRASKIYLERTRGQTGEPAGQFREHLAEAIRWYREALAQDATYTLAARNLSAALILRGVQTPKAGLHPDVAEAVGLLSRALEHAPQDPALLNTLGVALFYDDRADRAAETFIQAATRAPTDATPVCNLGVLARAARREAEAQRYQQACTQLSTGTAPAPAPARSPTETVTGLRPGTPVQAVPASWGVPMSSTIQIGATPYTVTIYSTAIMTLAQHGEILMLMVREGYQGPSAQGVMLGSRARDVLARYGAPTRRHELSHGHSWAYDAQRIAFQLHDGQVVSWLRF